MLADLGAEVIKIERPGVGDDARAFGPPYLVDPEGKANNNNSFYLCANRGKKSVTVNIAKPEGQAIIRELAKSCDVMMENYKVGDLKRYGLDYDSIKAINPGIIYCSVTGFGQNRTLCGPRRLPDAILQGDGRVDERHRPHRWRAGRGADEGRSSDRRLHDRHEHLGRHPHRAPITARSMRGRGPARRRLPVRHRDRLAVALASPANISGSTARHAAAALAPGAMAACQPACSAAPTAS